MKFKVHSLLMAALAVAAVSPAAMAVTDSVTLTPALLSATAVGGGTLPGTHPTTVVGSTLYVYGSAQAGVYNFGLNATANLNPGEGFGGIAAEFHPSSSAVSNFSYVADTTSAGNQDSINGPTVWNAGGTSINNAYNIDPVNHPNGILVANIGTYTTADTVRTNYAITAPGSIGTLTAQWDGATNNSTIKATDGTNDGVLNQISFNVNNTGTAQQGAQQLAGGQTDIQFVTALQGDADVGGTVDFNDLTTLLRHYGQTDSSWYDGNFTGGAQIGFNDLTALLRNYGKSWTTGLTPAFGSGAVAAAPEPASLAVVGLGAVSLLGRKKKARK